MSLNVWIGANWRDDTNDQSPPASWDGTKFVYIDPVFGDGVGQSAVRLRYIGPGLGGVAAFDMPINMRSIARPLQVRLLDTNFVALDTFIVDTPGRTTLSIPIGSYYGLSDNGFFIALSTVGEGLIYDADFTIGEPTVQEVFVYTMNRTGQVGAWSRYVFPFEIDDTALLGEKLYLRAGNRVYVMNEASTTDDGVPIAGIVQWPWLDFGTPGVTKMLQAVDVIGTGPGNISLQIGYDQRTVEAFTPAYTIPIDTLTGMPIPMPVSAPTLSVRLTFSGQWSLQAVNMYLADSRRTT